MLIGLARVRESESNDEKGAKEYYFKALAFRMGVAKYEGETTGNFMHSIKAHGKGKVTYESGGESFSGKFINGKLQETGEIEIQYPNKSIYKGTWKNKIFEGQGKFTFPSGVLLESEFKDTNPVGKAKVTFDKVEYKQETFLELLTDFE